ncbi:MAG: prepilin-type N-terminal cleavage/methylation domain-containing protein [Candidatus Omnitrophota bacterium]
MLPFQKPAPRSPFKRGFTLIEVLIVVVIVAILAAMLVPRLMFFPEKAKLAEAFQTVGMLARAQKQYMDTTGSTTGVTFSCNAPDDLTEPCDATSFPILNSLGISSIPQKNFQYYCKDSGRYCVAYRYIHVGAGVASQPYMYLIYRDANEGRWYCARGYYGIGATSPGTADTATSSMKGCQVNTEHPTWG